MEQKVPCIQTGAQVGSGKIINSQVPYQYGHIQWVGKLPFEKPLFWAQVGILLTPQYERSVPTVMIIANCIFTQLAVCTKQNAKLQKYWRWQPGVTSSVQAPSQVLTFSHKQDKQHVLRNVRVHQRTTTIYTYLYNTTAL